MSKTTKKNHWILKYMVFAIICVIAAILGSKINKNIPNIVGIIYILAGVMWFYQHTKVQIKVPKGMNISR